MLRRLSCFSLIHLNSIVEARPFPWSEIDMQNKSWREFFDCVLFVSWSLLAVPLFPSVHLTELAEKKPQRKQRSFPALSLFQFYLWFPLLCKFFDKKLSMLVIKFVRLIIRLPFSKSPFFSSCSEFTYSHSIS